MNSLVPVFHSQTEFSINLENLPAFGLCVFLNLSALLIEDLEFALDLRWNWIGGGLFINEQEPLKNAMADALFSHDLLVFGDGFDIGHD